MNAVLVFLVIASWGYWLFSYWCVRSFFRSSRKEKYDFTPPVSVLKPVEGLDPGAYENFASFARQDYPEFELLFGVLDSSDPAIPVINQLKRDFPDSNIELMLAAPLGTNRKVSILHHLASRAHHNVLVSSDSDMRAAPDYLRRVVGPLGDSRNGLVTCLYKVEEASNLVAGLEALYVGATYIPSIMVGRRYLTMRFAMGATTGFGREDLEAIGGFEVIADYLADDYQLGVRVADTGRRVHLSNYVISDVKGKIEFRDYWDRQVRWAKCARVSRSREYIGVFITCSTPWALTNAALSHFDSNALALLAGTLALRWTVAHLISGWTGDREVRRWLPLLPFADILAFFIWCGGALRRTVSWRGRRFVLNPDGRFRPLEVLPEEKYSSAD